MLNITITKLTASYSDEKTPSKFPCFDNQKGVSKHIHDVYYTTEDASDEVGINLSNTKAPVDGWCCSNYVLFVAGTKKSMKGCYLHPPKMTLRQ